MTEYRSPENSDLAGQVREREFTLLRTRNLQLERELELARSQVKQLKKELNGLRRHLSRPCHEKEEA